MSIAVFSLLVLLIAEPASVAQPDADGLLRRADAAARRSQDARFSIEVKVIHGDGTAVSRTIRIWQRGSDQRMVKFLAPARLRGTGLLVPEAGRILAFLPSYGRVREVTGREGGDAFMGTDFSANELALVRLAPDHSARFAPDSPKGGAFTSLLLTPKAPDDHDYATLRVKVRREDDLVAGLEYVDAAGITYRRVVLDDFRVAGTEGARYVTAHRIEVHDEKSDRRTVATVTEAAFDQALGDSFFTERSLRRLP